MYYYFTAIINVSTEDVFKSDSLFSSFKTKVSDTAEIITSSQEYIPSVPVFQAYGPCVSVTPVHVPCGPLTPEHVPESLVNTPNWSIRDESPDGLVPSRLLDYVTSSERSMVGIARIRPISDLLETTAG